MSFELIIAGGRVIDPSQKLDGISDIALGEGRIEKVSPGIPSGDALEIVDASGCIVIPGFVDMHTHIHWGGDSLSIDADSYAPLMGTTTWVDAGSSGAENFAGFRRFIIEKSGVRIVPFLNVSTPGLTGYPCIHRIIEHLDVDRAYATIEANRDLIKGIKVLCSWLKVGGNDLTPLRIAREIGEATDLPVMCHIGAPPPGLGAILPIMRPGDIITHTYKGNKGCLIIAGNRVRSEAWEAKKRGVLFDVGHGLASFSWEVARTSLEQGFMPDAISTDLHVRSLHLSQLSMPTLMGKFRHLGMELPEIVRLCTTRPAEILHLADVAGTLREGSPGDVAVLRPERGEFPQKDSMGVEETMEECYRLVLTVRNGKVLEKRRDPGDCRPSDS